MRKIIRVKDFNEKHIGEVIGEIRYLEWGVEYLAAVEKVRDAFIRLNQILATRNRKRMSKLNAKILASRKKGVTIVGVVLWDEEAGVTRIISGGLKNPGITQE